MYFCIRLENIIPDVTLITSYPATNFFPVHKNAILRLFDFMCKSANRIKIIHVHRMQIFIKPIHIVKKNALFLQHTAWCLRLYYVSGYVLCSAHWIIHRFIFPALLNILEWAFRENPIYGSSSWVHIYIITQYRKTFPFFPNTIFY